MVLEPGEASLQGQGLAQGQRLSSHSAQRSRAQEETSEHGSARGPMEPGVLRGDHMLAQTPGLRPVTTSSHGRPGLQTASPLLNPRRHVQGVPRR